MNKCFAFCLLSILNICFASADLTHFETGQLPLSKDLKNSFPKIKSERFIILSKKAGVVLHEKNSKEQIKTSIEALKTKKTNLYDVCLFLESSSNNSEHQFHSELLGIGCVEKYKNSNNCEFTYALYGTNSEEDLQHDIKIINEWLDQFFLYKVGKKEEVIANIPVFYAKKESLVPLKFDKEQFLLISKNSNKAVTITSKYRTMLRAPLPEKSIVGSVFYKTSTFENFIKKPLVTHKTIEKGSRFKTICDSIHYVIFATPFHSKSLKKDNMEN